MRTMQRFQQKAYDAAVPDRLGLPSLLLMEHAALGLQQACLAVLKKCAAATGGPAEPSCGRLTPFGCRAVLNQPVNILTGKGNNGGDGYALARLLAAAGREVCLWEWGREAADAGLSSADSSAGEGLSTDLTDAEQNRRAARALGLPFTALSDREDTRLEGLFVDCVLGTGFQKKRPLPNSLVAFFSRLEAARQAGVAYVLAADIPSGVEADTGLTDPGAVHADETVTFVYPKPGLYSYPGRGYCGRISCAGLGLPTTLTDSVYRQFAEEGPVVLTAERVSGLLPDRRAEGHKKEFGSCLLYAGSSEYIGAGLLATAAALASGAGLVTRLVEADIRAAAATALPSAIHALKPQTAEDLAADFVRREADCQSVLVGSGSGLTEATAQLTRLAAASSAAVILDADALTLLAKDPTGRKLLRERLNKGLPAAILTPHPGEFARLFPDLRPAELGRLEAARLAAERLQSVIVLKGAGTVVAAPAGLQAGGGLYLNTTGCSALAKGGSGDVLAGLIAGLAARGLSAVEAAICGVFWHGLAGDLEAASVGPEALIPDRLPERLGEAYCRLQELAGQAHAQLF